MFGIHPEPKRMHAAKAGPPKQMLGLINRVQCQQRCHSLVEFASCKCQHACHTPYWLQERTPLLGMTSTQASLDRPQQVA
jgi:hypothetical protein